MMILLALVLGFHAEPNEAEALFRDMEKKVTSAKSLECTFEGKMEGEKKSMSLKGGLAVAEGNKSYMVLQSDFEGKSHSFTTVCDGKEMHSIIDGTIGKAENIPKHFSETIHAFAVRLRFSDTLLTSRVQDKDTAPKRRRNSRSMKCSSFRSSNSARRKRSTATKLKRFNTNWHWILPSNRRRRIRSPCGWM